MVERFSSVWCSNDQKCATGRKRMHKDFSESGIRKRDTVWVSGTFDLFLITTENIFK